MSITAEILEQLKEEFSPDQLLVKVSNFNEDKTWAMLVRYLPHPIVADRLDEVDPAWSSEITHSEWRDDVEGKPSVFTSVRLTIMGVSRENSGQGKDPKAAASDAFKRAATLFGVGRYLYSGPKVWVECDPNDRYRKYTIEDYEAASSGSSSKSAKVPAASGRKPPVTPNKTPAVGKNSPPRTKRAITAEIDHLQSLLKYSDKELITWAKECGFGVSPDRMDLNQLEKFAGELQFEARKAGHRL